MFPIDLIRHKDPELFFAVAAPVGADLDSVCGALEEALKRFSYRLEPIRVIELLKQFEGYLVNDPQFADKKIEGRMDDGDRFRRTLERNDALALLALSGVVKYRAKHGSNNKPLDRTAYLFRSLKRPEEITALRRIYGSNLVVIGSHSGRSERVDHLAERIAKSYFSAQRDQYRDRAEKLILRDEADEQHEYGQRLRSAFALADFFVNSVDPQRLKRDLDRFLDILFCKPVVTPTPDELAVAHAHVAAMRSGEMGRQVGAAIVNCHGELIACGTNEVPKAHGGHYWDGDANDGRDWSHGFDNSDRFKAASLGELLQTLSAQKMLSQEFNKLNTPDQVKRLTPLIKNSRYMQLVEFIRAVHAEMSALLDAAARGAPVRGCTMYVTTFPCHECARNIVAAGIGRVVYIEPYAKSLALELHADSIQLDNTRDPGKIPFVPFLGVAPRNYENFFTMPKRKGSDGRLAEWDPASANPRVSGSFWSYLQYEKEDLKNLRVKLKQKHLL